ncbi:hypothetical protein, partial [Arthrobacter sp. H41]|uniref:hypothetical protein n=1 Tax=Arthrobacter sp. H41 TaxID=1312978 RepID=UPI001C1DD255
YPPTDAPTPATPPHTLNYEEPLSLRDHYSPSLGILEDHLSVNDSEFVVSKGREYFSPIIHGFILFFSGNFFSSPLMLKGNYPEIPDSSERAQARWRTARSGTTTTSLSQSLVVRSARGV